MCVRDGNAFVFHVWSAVEEKIRQQSRKKIEKLKGKVRDKKKNKKAPEYRRCK